MRLSTVQCTTTVLSNTQIQSDDTHIKRECHITAATMAALSRSYPIRKKSVCTVWASGCEPVTLSKKICFRYKPSCRKLSIAVLFRKIPLFPKKSHKSVRKLRETSPCFNNDTNKWKNLTIRRRNNNEFFGSHKIMGRTKLSLTNSLVRY